jgi:hypothetical protein
MLDPVSVVRINSLHVLLTKEFKIIEMKLDQLNSHYQIYRNFGAWIKYIQESEESTMVRFEAEQRPRRCTLVSHDKILVRAKKEYLDSLLDLYVY